MSRRPFAALRSLLVALLTVAALLAATPAFALDVPPTPGQWFTDTAGVVPGSDAAALNEKLRNFEQQRGVQFIIYVFPTLGSEAVEDFTIRCVQRWKVGNKKYDNGLVLFVFVKEKKVRIEVGYGLEGTITDAFSSQVIRDYLAPKFQAGDYAGGLNAAADALIARITKQEAPVPPVSPGASGATSGGAAPGRSGIDPFFIIVIAVLFFLFVLPMLRRRRGIRGGGSGCSGCFIPWMLMGGGGGTTFGGGGFGGGGGGGFSGGGGSFGGGGATGGW